jgi:RNA polymerase sigma-70 factor (ECF subfamily)
MVAPPAGPARGEGPPRLTLTAEREGDLRARLCARDERALEELIELTTPWLLGLVQGMLHDEDETEDVLLHTFRTVWDRIEPGGPAPLLPLVFRIARNHAIDRLRGQSRRAALRVRLRHETDADAPAVSPEPGTRGQAGWQIHAQVRAALAELPEEQRTVIRLAYYQGLTQSDIATRLALPLGTVKTRLRLAYGKLRTALAALQDWTE